MDRHCILFFIALSVDSACPFVCSKFFRCSFNFLQEMVLGWIMVFPLFATQLSRCSSFISFAWSSTSSSNEISSFEDTWDVESTCEVDSSFLCWRHLLCFSLHFLLRSHASTLLSDGPFRFCCGGFFCCGCLRCCCCGSLDLDLKFNLV